MLIWTAVFIGAVLESQRYWNRTAVAASTVGLSRVERVEKLAKESPSSANYLTLARVYVEDKRYRDASRAYGVASEIIRSTGEISRAYQIEAMSDRYNTSVKLFLHRRAKLDNVRKHYSAKRLEPVYGCYVGAFIDHEDSIKGTYRDEYGTWRRDVSSWNHLVGTKHALFFMYSGYGRKFPKAFVEHMKLNESGAQIAWEPKSLDQVQDDTYLRAWAREARDSGVPIFIRFASEMNGDWTPYHGDPKKYIEKFRLVSKVMHEEAPNVAMVWCPFEIPVRLIDDYFPGDDVVDWVGVNIYSVPFLDNDPKRGAEWRNPADQLRTVYNRYAGRHPIMICEYASSHMSSLDMVPRAEFARDKIGQFYASLPRLYPRVKAVCWLSMNAVKHAMPGRQKNNYALLDDDTVRKRYEQMLYSKYFLTRVSLKQPGMAGEEIIGLHKGEVLKGKVGLSAWVKTHEEEPTVRWLVNGEERVYTKRPGPYKWTLDTTKLSNGPVTIALEVSDATGKLIERVERTGTISN